MLKQMAVEVLARSDPIHGVLNVRDWLLLFKKLVQSMLVDVFIHEWTNKNRHIAEDSSPETAIHPALDSKTSSGLPRSPNFFNSKPRP